MAQRSHITSDLTKLLNELLHSQPPTSLPPKSVAPGPLGRGGLLRNVAPTQEPRYSPRTYSLGTIADDPTRRLNASGNERQGMKYREFQKTDQNTGDTFRYHEYQTPSGKRKVFRVGGPVNRRLT